MKMLYVMLGDIKSSTQIPDRRSFQQVLRSACRRLNRTAGRDIVASFKPLKGVDEVGGALASPGSAYDLVVGFLDTIRPQQARFVLTYGEVDVGSTSADVADMDGPAFNAAADAMADLKESDLVFKTDLGVRSLDASVTGLANALLLQRHRWTERQSAAVAAYREQGSQSAAAARLHITQQAVSKALEGASWRDLAVLEAYLREALRTLQLRAVHQGARQT